MATVDREHNQPSSLQQTHYLDWALQGKHGLLRYILRSIVVLSMSLMIGQIFSALGATLISSTSPAATIIKTTFFGFIVSFLTIPIIVHFLHKRPWWSVALPYPKFQWRNFTIGLASTSLVILAITTLSYFNDPTKFKYVGAEWNTWIPMLIISFLAFFVQAGTEEMVYRGYIAQFVRSVTSNKIAILLIPALIFSLPHLGNIEGANGAMALLPYIIMGILYGWLAYRSGSLWMSLGAHIANNWFITMFVGSVQEKIEKVSLFQVGQEPIDLNMLVLSSLMHSLLVAALAEVLIRITKPK